MKKHIQNILLILCTWCFACSETGEALIPKKNNQIDEQTNSIPYSRIGEVGFGLVRSGNSSLRALNAVLSTEEIDFNKVFFDLLKDQEFRKIFPDINTSLFDPATAPMVLPPDTVTVNLNNAYSYLNFDIRATDYFKRLVEIIPEYDNSADAVNYPDLFEKIAGLQREISVDVLLQIQQKNTLLVMLQTFSDNLVQIVTYTDDYLIKLSGGRTAGWVKKAWRKVRSVIVTTVVTAGAGFMSGGPIGAIVGGAIGLVSSTLDVVLNDRCWYAMKCDGGWKQSCNTGECLTNDMLPLPQIPVGSSQQDEEAILEKYYSDRQIANCGGREGRTQDACSYEVGTLTFNTLDQLGRENGVYQDVETRYSYLSSSKRWTIYKWQLAYIFEDAVLKALRLEKNEKRFSTLQGKFVIPDGVHGSAKEDWVVDQNNGQRRFVKATCWSEGTFVESKITQTDEIPFDPPYNPYQISKMIEVLSTTMNDAYVCTNRFSYALGIGTPMVARAADYNAALLHFITPADVFLSEEIKTEAIKNKVTVLHSTVVLVPIPFSPDGIRVTQPRYYNDRGTGLWNRPISSIRKLDWTLRKWTY